jgi:sigma-B regulation protein RsbU (phosphoserine phosphatase)
MIVPTLGVALLARNQRAATADLEAGSQDARLAAQMRQRLLPRYAPMIGGWDLAAHHQSATRDASARDLYDFMILPDGRLVLALTTVADKGAHGLHLMTTTRAALRTAAGQTPSAGKALSMCSDLICPDLRPESAVATLLALLDPASGRLQIANAGLSAPVRWNGSELVEMRDGNSLLGQSLGVEYDHDDILLGPGESVLFYSPGALGARPETGEPFGPERVRRVLGAAGATTAQGMVDALRMDLSEFADADSLSHLDITLLALARPPSKDKAEQPRRSLRDELRALGETDTDL